MVAIYYKQENKTCKSSDAFSFTQENFSAILWIDMNDATTEEILHVEKILDINIPDEATAEEIEQSSRYSETEKNIVINTNFLVEKDDFYVNYAVSFILIEGILVSYRNGDLRSFADTVKRFKTNNQTFQSGNDFLVALLESRIELDADLLELLSSEISSIIKDLNLSQEVGAKQLYHITHLQETTMILRENIIDNQRLLSSMIKSVKFPKEFNNTLRALLKDTQSLIDHTVFSFDRLEYLQNTVLGLINLEQSKIIKIFTVVSLAFLPPTLIASIFGMNFQYEPGINHVNGFWFAFAAMLLCSFVTVYTFKRKKWL
jgi:magnesium transporter